MPLLQPAITREEQHSRQIAYWLFFCAAVIFGMILLGGVTRLTNYGRLEAINGNCATAFRGRLAAYVL